jgi:hypothetical protein
MLFRFTYLICATGKERDKTLLYHTQVDMHPLAETIIKERLADEIGEILDISIHKLEGYEKEKLTKPRVPPMTVWTAEEILQQKSA